MRVRCEFEISSWFENFYYVCTFSNEQIPEDEEVFYVGNHIQGRSRLDVTTIHFEDCKMTKVPEKFTEKFTNLKALIIENCGLKSLNRSDLDEYKNVEYLNFGLNETEFLPSDLLAGFRNLVKVSFGHNKLTFIEPNIFDEFYQLRHVNLLGNLNYDKCYSEYNLDVSTVSLEGMKIYLFEKFYSKFKFAQKLQSANENLIKENSQLKFDLENKNSQISELVKYSQKDLVKDLKSITQNEAFKDFTIIIGSQKFHVHKFLLAARSPTLAEMLQNNPEAENLKLVDISVEIFEIILKFIYTDECPSENKTNFLELFAAASRLKIESLKNFAATKLSIKPDNIVEILKLSNK